MNLQISRFSDVSMFQVSNRRIFRRFSMPRYLSAYNALKNSKFFAARDPNGMPPMLFIIQIVARYSPAALAWQKACITLKDNARAYVRAGCCLFR